MHCITQALSACWQNESAANANPCEQNEFSYYSSFISQTYTCDLNITI